MKSNEISHTEKLTLSIKKKDFLLIAKPLVDDIDDAIRKELYHCAQGIINGDCNSSLYGWEWHLYRELQEDNKIELTDLGKTVYNL